MKKKERARSSGRTRAALVCILTFASVALAAVSARAQVPQTWVGSWYSETKEDKEVAGEKYDMRRELLVNRGDGTKRNTFRYYLGGRLVKEFVVTYRWGVTDKTYWTVCQTILVAGEATPCDARFEYDVIAVTDKEVRYKSKQTGIEYSALRVADGFKLP
jgi:hypothetical protein